MMMMIPSAEENRVGVVRSTGAPTTCDVDGTLRFRLLFVGRIIAKNHRNSQTQQDEQDRRHHLRPSRKCALVQLKMSSVSTAIHRRRCDGCGDQSGAAAGELVQWRRQRCVYLTAARVGDTAGQSKAARPVTYFKFSNSFFFFQI